jgi:hypothetical protein
MKQPVDEQVRWIVHCGLAAAVLVVAAPEIVVPQGDTALAQAQGVLLHLWDGLFGDVVAVRHPTSEVLPVERAAVDQQHRDRGQVMARRSG